MDSKAVVLITTEKNNILYAALTGKGVKYDDRSAYKYKVSIEVSKAEAKRIKAEVLELWEQVKSSDQGSKPANWKNIVYKTKDGKLAVTADTNVEFDGEPIEIPIREGKRNELLDPKKFGSIGAGSTGRVSFNLKGYESGRKEGISMFLRGLQLSTFVPYVGGTDTSGDYDTDDEADDLSGGAAYVPEKKEKKKESSQDSPLIEEFNEALEDEDWDEAADLLDELEGNDAYKKLKKALKKAKKASGKQ